MPETAIDIIDGVGYFSSDERKWITKVRKLKEKCPDDVDIIRQPENNDGCIYCKLPANWLRISPPAKREYSDEQLEIMRIRLKNSRKLCSSEDDKGDDVNA